MSKNLRFIHIWQKEILIKIRSQCSKANERVQFQQKFSSLPIAVSKQVLSKHFWPKFIHCKLWQQGERNHDSIRRKDKATPGGNYMAIPITIPV
jgi:hypothetical protein